MNLPSRQLYEGLIREPTLCMLFKEGVSVDILANLAEVFDVVDVEVEGRTRFAVRCAWHEPRNAVKGKVLNPNGNITEAEEG